MEIKEIYVAKLGWYDKIEDERLVNMLVKHAKVNIKGVEDKAKNTIERLKQAFLEKGYIEEEMAGDIILRINAFNDNYYAELNVYVYPRTHRDVYLQEQVMPSTFFLYTSKDYIKEMNELGTQIKERVNTLLKIAELEKEVERLRKWVSQLEAELERCKEREEEDP